MDPSFWQHVTAFFLANLIPAGVFQAQMAPLPPPPLLELEVAPLAKILNEEVSIPVVAATSALVIETHSNEVLHEQNVWEVLPIASLTKLMTALVVREHLDTQMEVTVSGNAASTPGSRATLVTGEVMTVHELLKGLLITSGNDAAVTLAEATAGTESAFAELMNDRAQSLGLHSTRFQDASGLSPLNVSTAFEIAHLAKQVFKDPVLQEIMQQKDVVISSTDGGITHQLKNTNRLLGSSITDRVIAGKTGTTPQAGQCLVSFISHPEGRKTMMILLGSQNRFGEMESLVNWVDQKFYW